MKFLMIVKGNAESEAGVMPSQELISAMMDYNEQLRKAGMLIDLNGLHPTRDGAKVKFKDRKTTVVDGPFTETKEIFAGYWIIKANSLQEAIEWARKVPTDPKNPDQEGEIEIRQIFELDEFDEGHGIDKARHFEKEFAKQVTRS